MTLAKPTQDTQLCFTVCLCYGLGFSLQEAAQFRRPKNHYFLPHQRGNHMDLKAMKAIDHVGENPGRSLCYFYVE